MLRDMKSYSHLFFDLDKTIAPAREPILPEMFTLLSELPQDIIIVSGQDVKKIHWQSNHLPAFVLGQNGNHAVDMSDHDIWNTPLTDKERAEILHHIEQLLALLPEPPNPDWTPVEDRGAQITFSPIGNTAPIEHKRVYDPDRKKRAALLEAAPFVSDNLVVKFGGTTSFDYIPKDRQKGANVQRFIDYMKWQNEKCVYFGDGLFPGGNDESVIGVIDTVPVEDQLDTERKLKEMFNLPNQDKPKT